MSSVLIDTFTPASLSSFSGSSSYDSGSSFGDYGSSGSSHGGYSPENYLFSIIFTLILFGVPIICEKAISLGVKNNDKIINKYFFNLPSALSIALILKYEIMYCYIFEKM